MRYLKLRFCDNDFTYPMVDAAREIYNEYNFSSVTDDDIQTIKSAVRVLWIALLKVESIERNRGNEDEFDEYDFDEWGVVEADKVHDLYDSRYNGDTVFYPLDYNEYIEPFII